MKLQDITYLARYPVLALIRLYQKTLSFDHGPMKALYPQGFCRFHPTCSEYGYESIKRQGLVKGGIKTLYRIIRCNPWSPGGVDKPS
ncbi:TPA: membrane protein insertion efficiency factor YidD [Candidatus Uhrbacteria bacterium]|nr:membrane protein insertion efficiency factor YidD [Candidatus Uhrbacteria bacterium]